MAHVMLAAQQAHHVKMAIAKTDCKTAYMVFDFKQKLLANGYCEGGDSYYRKKGILWFGAGVHIKANRLQEEAKSNAKSIEQLYVEIDGLEESEEGGEEEEDGEEWVEGREEGKRMMTRWCGMVRRGKIQVKRMRMVRRWRG